MRKLSFLFLFVLCFSSCKEEVINYTLDDLHGYWDVAKAKRDGQVTSTLQGAYIKIKGNEMMDNIFSNTNKFEISIDGNKFIHHMTPPKEYKILSASKDTLVLSTKHKDYKFEFTLSKVAD